MKVFEQELKKGIENSLADIDKRFAIYHANMAKHFGGKPRDISCDCADFDWSLSDSMLSMRQVAAERHIFLDCVKELSSIYESECPLAREAALLDFYRRLRRGSRLRLPSIHNFGGVDQETIEIAYECAIRVFERAIYAEKFDQEDL